MAQLTWFILGLMGIQKLHIVPGFTEANALDLYYMPYTHSRPGLIVLTLIFGGIVAVFTNGNRWATILLVAAALFSHWVVRSCRAHARFAALRQCGQGRLRTMAARCLEFSARADCSPALALGFMRA